MKTYFSLQYRRINRMLDEFGIAPWLAHLLIPITFLLFSILLFFKLSYAKYLFPLFAFSFLLKLGNAERNYFLKNTFSSQDFTKIRLLENGLIALPFFLFLIYQKAYLVSAVFTVVSLLLSFFNTLDKRNKVIPTPFSQRPFEFIIGFRKTYLLFPLLFVLCYISITVWNFNLGAFSLILVFFIAMSYYSKCEPIYFVWVSARSPSEFLNEKIETAVKHSLMLSAPFFVALLIAFPNCALIVLGLELLSISYVIMSLLAKYAYYPSEISLLPALAMGASLFFPPLLLLTIPIFYKRSKRNLLLYK